MSSLRCHDVKKIPQPVGGRNVFYLEDKTRSMNGRTFVGERNEYDYFADPIIALKHPLHVTALVF